MNFVFYTAMSTPIHGSAMLICDSANGEQKQGYYQWKHTLNRDFNFSSKSSPRLALQSYTGFYSILNISEAQGNNQLTFLYKVEDSYDSFDITIDDGNYTVKALNDNIQSKLADEANASVPTITAVNLYASFSIGKCFFRFTKADIAVEFKNNVSPYVLMGAENNTPYPHDDDGDPVWSTGTAEIPQDVWLENVGQFDSVSSLRIATSIGITGCYLDGQSDSSIIASIPINVDAGLQLVSQPQNLAFFDVNTSRIHDFTITITQNNGLPALFQTDSVIVLRLDW